MNAIYNEIEPYAAAWLENLIAAGHIAPGRVERRSVADLTPDDVRGHGQRHFFAGIGGWSHALRLAGVPDDADVWTGSCPCQGLSDAGKRLGALDPRHLWPAWFALIAECRPPVIYGEQVASRLGLDWLDLVYADLERCGYAVGAADLCAASVGAPHIRQRLYFVAIARDERHEGERLHVREWGPRARLHEVGGGRPASWATPAAKEAGGTPEQFLMRKRKAKAKGSELGESVTSLAMQAQFAPVAERAPSTEDSRSTTALTVAPWATPLSTSSRGQPDVEKWLKRKQKARPGSTQITELNMQAQLSAWPTTGARDARGPTRGRMAQGAMQLGQTALLIHGADSNGSPAPTARRGQLNPDLSRWLMGYPVEWLFAAPSNRPAPRFKKSTGTTAAARSTASATRSSRSSRRSSSAAPKKRGGR